MDNKSLKIKYMTEAISEAKKCVPLDEVPIGAVIVRRGEIIASAGNRRETNRDATCHAEISAIREACEKSGGWHLTDCEMYVTLEPCPMCAGAIVNARIDKVIIGADEEKFGAFGSLFNLCDFGVNHKPEIERGVLKEECSRLLSEFFRAKRERGKRFCLRQEK